jgi:hypothetical protein
VNTYQGMVMNATGWFLVLLDGWAMHTHWVAVLGFVFLIYSMWSICMDTEKKEGAQGWRKRQIVSLQTSIESFEDWEHSHQPQQFWVERRAYLAGFEAGRKYERLVETND